MHNRWNERLFGKEDQRNERSGGKMTTRKNKGEKPAMEDRVKIQWRESSLVFKEQEHFLLHMRFFITN